jgi:uncharacterized YccA/Bax inhibitor family protein
MMRTANPALNKNTFANLVPSASHEVMTIDGTVNKSFFMIILLLVTAFFSWNQFSAGNTATLGGLFFLGLIGGLIVAIITIFKKQWAPVTAPIYALLQGLVLGTISSFFEKMFPGIVIQAVALTFGVFFALLLAYKSRMIKVTDNFRLGVVAATGGVMIVYLISFVMGLFGTSVPYIHGSGLIGIGFSLVVVIIASLNLVLDFDFIEKGAEHKAPKYMESFAAFGLLVTLIWLYIEILHLLSKLRSRN